MQFGFSGLAQLKKIVIHEQSQWFKAGQDKLWPRSTTSAQRVGFFQYWVGSGQVLDKILGSGSGSGRVGVSKNTIGYFRVSFLLSGISGISG